MTQCPCPRCQGPRHRSTAARAQGASWGTRICPREAACHVRRAAPCLGAQRQFFCDRNQRPRRGRMHTQIKGNPPSSNTELMKCLRRRIIAALAARSHGGRPNRVCARVCLLVGPASGSVSSLVLVLVSFCWYRFCWCLCWRRCRWMSCDAARKQTREPQQATSVPKKKTHEMSKQCRNYAVIRAIRLVQIFSFAAAVVRFAMFVLLCRRAGGLLTCWSEGSLWC